MKDHERRELVNRLTKIAREYGQTQQLRERIAHELLSSIKSDSSFAAQAAAWRSLVEWICTAPTNAQIVLDNAPNGRIIRDVDTPQPRLGDQGLETQMTKIEWTASNNSSFLNGSREASSIAAAVRAARRYIRGELYGEGKATIFKDGNPVRRDEYSIHTGYKWDVRTDF